MPLSGASASSAAPFSLYVMLPLHSELVRSRDRSFVEIVHLDLRFK